MRAIDFQNLLSEIDTKFIEEIYPLENQSQNGDIVMKENKITEIVNSGVSTNKHRGYGYKSVIAACAVLALVATTIITVPNWKKENGNGSLHLYSGSDGETVYDSETATVTEPVVSSEVTSGGISIIELPDGFDISFAYGAAQYFDQNDIEIKNLTEAQLLDYYGLSKEQVMPLYLPESVILLPTVGETNPEYDKFQVIYNKEDKIVYDVNPFVFADRKAVNPDKSSNTFALKVQLSKATQLDYPGYWIETIGNPDFLPIDNDGKNGADFVINYSSINGNDFLIAHQYNSKIGADCYLVTFYKNDVQYTISTADISQEEVLKIVNGYLNYEPESDLPTTDAPVTTVDAGGINIQHEIVISGDPLIKKETIIDSEGNVIVKQELVPTDANGNATGIIVD
ncbi:hypothetical protein FACS1894132_07220 [Clostridia bacterium]|nr:hypothetical protein FACS1894132_07220 [Clostridia bacterium]